MRLTNQRLQIVLQPLISLWLKVGIILRDIEAGTGLLGIEVVVTDDQCVRVGFVELDEEGTKAGTLLVIACVGRLALGIETANVADADGVAVVALAVGANEFLGTTDLYLAIGGDDVVVAAAVPAKGTVVAVDVGASQLGVGGVGGAVDDDECYGTHREDPPQPSL